MKATHNLTVGKKVAVVRRNGERVVGKIVNLDTTGHTGTWASVEYKDGKESRIVRTRPSQCEKP